MDKLKNKHDLMIEFCRQQANLSKCKDAKTAAILVKADMTQIYSIGINGGPRGGADCLCVPAQEAYEIKSSPNVSSHKVSAKAKYSCVHAEQNCLVKNTTVDQVEKILICTKQPCTVCASLIVNSCTNIIEVWYIDSYWDDRGIKLLRDAKIFVGQLTQYTNGGWCFK